MRALRAICVTVALATLSLAGASQAQFTTTEQSLLSGIGDWDTTPAFTVGETIDGYIAPGILDGMGAMALDVNTVRVFVNHEMRDEQGYSYALANGTAITGARVSYFDFDRATRDLVGSGLAYDEVIDRYGNVVTAANQINEGFGNATTDGFDRFCSAWLGNAGQYGLVDDIFFAGEETGGGQEFALDVQTGKVYCVPALGRAAFEAVTMIDHPDPTKVAAVIGDDRAPAPLLLYVGEKGAIGDDSFLDRNGLAQGQLYAWVSDAGFANPSTFNGTGTTASGTFEPIAYFDADQAGMAGYDLQGYADQGTQDAAMAAVGAFLFSRPEDVSTNPADGSQAVLASTGRSNLFGGVDSWGMTYIIDFDLDGVLPTADLTIAYDGDDSGDGQFVGPDYGLRSPDNLVWSENGRIYVQEDRGFSSFGTVSAEEASIWELDPDTGVLTRVAQVDRSVLPTGQTDGDPNDIGDWETSGIIDVTSLFDTTSTERLLFATVQAHSVTDGIISTANLVQGGQLVFMSNLEQMVSIEDPDDVTPMPDGVYQLSLARNRPNPFNPSTKIAFSLAQEESVRLSIHDLAGRRVTTLVDEVRGSGEYEIIWNGVDHRGRSVPSGVYIYRLDTGARRLTRSMTLVK